MAGKVLMGIGNEMKGDDAIGHLIAKDFKAGGWLSIPCGTVPENFTSVVRRERPELVVIVDAAEIGGFPGQFRILPKESLNSDIEGTHGMPLSFLVKYLEEIAPKVVFIGIQPKTMEMGAPITPAVLAAKKRIIGILTEEAFDSL